MWRLIFLPPVLAVGILLAWGVYAYPFVEACEGTTVQGVRDWECIK